MSKRIVYVGQEKCDFAYYLSCALSTQGSVLVADNSIRGDLYTSINKSEDGEEFEWRNITFTRNLDLTSDTEEFDFVLVYAGHAVEDEQLFDAKELTVLAMPDYSKQSIEAVKKISVDLSDENCLVITRDKCTKKVSEKGIAAILGISPKKIEGSIDLSLKYEASYIALTHNGKQNIKGASDIMQEAVVFTVAKILYLDEKQSKKLVAKARKLK